MGNRHHTKKKGELIAGINQLFAPKEIRIPPGQQNAGSENPNAIGNVIKELLSHFNQPVQNGPKPEQPNETLVDILSLMAEMATGVWRTRQKMLAPQSEQPLEEFRKPFRPLDSTYQAMLQSGLEIIDRVNQPYVIGLSEKVIAFDELDGFDREIIIETIKPSILYHGQLLQIGEIVVGAPRK